MLRRGIHFIKRLKASTSGNAAMMVALGTPAMIGGAGYAVDMGQWYMWKRELQHSVDQAAIAGAWALVHDEESDTYRVRARQEYDTNQKMTAGFDSFDEEEDVELVDFAGGTDNAVLVTASATKKLPFSSFLTNSSATIQVRAQASFAPGANYNACLVSTAEEGTGTTIGGNATVNAACGLAALSCSEGAVDIDGSADVTTDLIAACGTINYDPDTDDEKEKAEAIKAEGVRSLIDKYKGLATPEASGNGKAAGSCTGRAKAQTYNPGTYSGLVVKCDSFFNSGVYVVSGGTLDLSANAKIEGYGVMFVLQDGATLKLGGSGSNGSLRLTPMTVDQIRDQTELSDDYAGMLIFEDRENDAGSNPGHKINGNSKSSVEGTIYLPDGDVSISGNSGTTAQCLNISAYRIKITGNAKLSTFCPSDKSIYVGSALARVRLVG